MCERKRDSDSVEKKKVVRQLRNLKNEEFDTESKKKKVQQEIDEKEQTFEVDENIEQQTFQRKIKEE